MIPQNHPNNQATETRQHESVKFDIRNFTSMLEPTTKADKYLCPICKGNDLYINPNNGAYKCYNNGCPEHQIREAVSPWAEVLAQRGERYNPQAKFKRIKNPPHKISVPLPSGELTIAALPEPATDSPQRKTPSYAPKKVRGKSNLREIVYNYGGGKTVHRYEWDDPTKAKGYDKTFRQCHLDAEGKTIWSKGDEPWHAYKIEEVIKACLDTDPSLIPVILWNEGEEATEALRKIGYAAITAQGSAWVHSELVKSLQLLKSQLAENNRTAIVAMLPDNDSTGANKCKLLEKACAEVEFPFVAVDLKSIKPDLCKKGDVVDILASGMNGDELAEKLLEEINRIRDTHLEHDKHEPDVHDAPGAADIPNAPNVVFNPNVEITQIVLNTLYSDTNWICADNKLYYWTGNHYKHEVDGVELRRISNFCNCYPVTDKYGEIKYPYANPGAVKKILEWVKIRCTVKLSLLNPPGLNCTNGVLQLSWDGRNPSWKLLPHTPDLYYTHEPLIKFDPAADSQHCDRLLEALAPAQREIFLRIIAASLDFSTIRKYHGRAVRILLMKGDGSNGKDSLREVVSLMYGRQGMTGCTISDFASYDEGRKFPLARLLHSRINWSSENGNVVRLDKIQSLKALITGEPLDSERKGIDPEEFLPSAIAIFNLNDTPNMQGALEAIKSRFAVMDFLKTFTINADPSKGEIEADPRFKYDPMFMASQVAPAFLNRVLQALVDLAREGINYECTKVALQEIQAENCHLYQFCQDVGINYAPDQVMTGAEIWSYLERWYQENGTLTYEYGANNKAKAMWVDQTKASDKNVKAVNQVIARFTQLFPKAKRVAIPHPQHGTKKSIPAIQGLGFINRLEDKEAPPPAEDATTNARSESTPKNNVITVVPPLHPQTIINKENDENNSIDAKSGFDAEKKDESKSEPQNAGNVKHDDTASGEGGSAANKGFGAGGSESVIGSASSIEGGGDSQNDLISLLQIELDGGDPNGFIGCQVQVRGLNHQVKFQGKLIGYDKVNGNVTVQILDNNNGVSSPSIHQKIASVRETFVTS